MRVALLGLPKKFVTVSMALPGALTDEGYVGQRTDFRNTLAQQRSGQNEGKDAQEHMAQESRKTEENRCRMILREW